MNKIVSLDFHDFSIENNNFFYLMQIKEMYPDIKISMFYIPADVEYYQRLMDLQKETAKTWIRDAVKDGWIELIPHGISHIFGEFRTASYDDMKLALAGYEEHFKELGVPYIKGFCAPNWLMSEQAIKCLDDNGWWYATDRNQSDMLKAKRNYTYNWSTDESFPDLPVVMGHGHISPPSKNNLPDSMRQILKIPHDATWKFVSEMMK